MEQVLTLALGAFPVKTGIVVSAVGRLRVGNAAAKKLSVGRLEVDELVIGMLVSFDAGQVTSRMRTAGPRSGPGDQGEAGKPPGRYPHEA
jgi:hypothetical protein